MGLKFCMWSYIWYWNGKTLQLNFSFEKVVFWDTLMIIQWMTFMGLILHATGGGVGGRPARWGTWLCSLRRVLAGLESSWVGWRMSGGRILGCPKIPLFQKWNSVGVFSHFSSYIRSHAKFQTPGIKSTGCSRTWLFI